MEIVGNYHLPMSLVLPPPPNVDSKSEDSSSSKSVLIEIKGHFVKGPIAKCLCSKHMEHTLVTYQQERGVFCHNSHIHNIFLSLAAECES